MHVLAEEMCSNLCPNWLFNILMIFIKLDIFIQATLRYAKAVLSTYLQF